MFLILLSALIWAVYNVVVAVRHGVQKSLSATYYTETGRQWLPWVIGVVVLLLGAVSFDVVSEDWRWLAFLSLFGLAVVGAAPMSRSWEQGRVHTAGAVLSGVCSQVLVAVEYPWILLGWQVFIPLMLCFPKAKLYWAEMIMFVQMLAMMFYLVSK